MDKNQTNSSMKNTHSEQKMNNKTDNKAQNKRDSMQEMKNNQSGNICRKHEGEMKTRDSFSNMKNHKEY